MAETWRVVLASGEVREVEVHRDDADTRYSTSTHRWCAGGMRGRTARSAVMAMLALKDWEVVEILAPGELTRAEILAGVEAYAAQLAPMARVVDVLRAAAVAAGHPAADGDPDAQLCAVRAQAWREGAEAMRRDCAKTCEQVAARQRASAHVPDTSARWSEGIADGADVCATYVRDLPVPPCPEVSR